MWVVENDNLRSQPFATENPSGYLCQIVLGQGLSSHIAIIDYRQGYGVDGGFIYEQENVDPTPWLSGLVLRIETGLNFAKVSLVGHDGFCFSEVRNHSYLYPERFWLKGGDIYVLATQNHPIALGETVIANCEITVNIPQAQGDEVVIDTGYADFNCARVDVAGLSYTLAAATPQVGEFTQSGSEITLQVSPTQSPNFNDLATLIGQISTVNAVAHAQIKVFDLRRQLQNITYIDSAYYRARSFVPPLDPWSPQPFELIHNEVQQLLFLFCPV